MTLGGLMGFYRNALDYPVIKIHDHDEWNSSGPDTGSVFSVEDLNVTTANDAYIRPYEVTEAQNYFNEHFVLKQLGQDPHDKRVDFKDEYYKDGELDTERARAAIQKYYNELPAGAVVLLNELAIHMPTDTGMECYRFWRVIELFKRQLNGGGPGGPGDGPDNGDGPATGNITSVDDLPGDGPMLGKAKDFLGKYITYEYKNDAYSDIHINGTKIVNDLFDKPEVAAKAVDAYYAMVQEMEGTRTVLDNLRIRVDDQLWMFSRRMDYYAQMVKFGMSKGDPDVTTDSLKPDDAVTIMLRDSGFTPPELGVDFTVTVPSPLERGKDYNYNYEIVDGVGILTMEVYKGDKQHWIQAGLNNPSGILYDVITRSPAGLTYHDSLCGNGGGIWDAYAKGEIPLRHYTEPTSGHGNGLAAVNMQNGMMTVTAIENYGDMMMLSIWNDHEKMDGDNLVKHLMLARIRVVDPFSYEAVTGDDAPPAVNAQDEARVQYKLDNEGQWKVTRYEEQLVICPANGTLAEQFERDRINPIGTLSITAPEGYTALDAVPMEMQWLPRQELNVINGVWECARVFPFQTRDGRAVPGTRAFVLYWSNDQGNIYRETFALCFRDTGTPLLDRLKDAYTDANKDANSTPADDVVFSLQPEAIAQKAIDEVVSPGMTVIYDRERGSLTVCFSFSQDYRGMLVEWVDANNKVLGYTFAYGRNDPFVTATRTEVTVVGPEPGNLYEEPFAVAEGGIALYVGMAVSSAVGMAWVGKKKD